MAVVMLLDIPKNATYFIHQAETTIILKEKSISAEPL